MKQIISFLIASIITAGSVFLGYLMGANSEKLLDIYRNAGVKKRNPVSYKDYFAREKNSGSNGVDKDY